MRSILVLALVATSLPSLALAQADGVPRPPTFDVDPPPEWTSAELHPADPFAPLPPPPLRERESIRPAYHGALIGQLAGLAFGALAGLFALELAPCAPPPEAPAWTCEEQRLITAGVAAAIAAPLGTAMGAIAGAYEAGQTGDAGMAFWGALAGWLPALIAVVPAVLTSEALVGIVGAHLIGDAFSSWLAAIGFDGRWRFRARVDERGAALSAATTF